MYFIHTIWHLYRKWYSCNPVNGRQLIHLRCKTITLCHPSNKLKRREYATLLYKSAHLDTHTACSIQLHVDRKEAHKCLLQQIICDQRVARIISRWHAYHHRYTQSGFGCGKDHKLGQGKDFKQQHNTRDHKEWAHLIHYRRHCQATWHWMTDRRRRISFHVSVIHLLKLTQQH